MRLSLLIDTIQNHGADAVAEVAIEGESPDDGRYASSAPTPPS